MKEWRKNIREVRRKLREGRRKGRERRGGRSKGVKEKRIKT